MPSPLPAQELEEALTAHYLRADGPYGPTPLMFVDATETELSKALKIESPDEARRRFLASFLPYVVSVVFRKGTESVGVQGGDCPGYFRYLMLSCVIECTSEELLDRGRLPAAVGAATRDFENPEQYPGARRDVGKPAGLVRIAQPT